MEAREPVSGKDISTYRQRLRPTPGRVASALGMTADDLLSLEAENRLLPSELVPRWADFQSLARASRGHIRRAAPMKDLPFPGKREDYVCDRCRLPLVRRKDFLSFRAS
jgi:hypothetical protein